MTLQEDLTTLGQWEADWQMKFNMAKCHSIRVTPHQHQKQILFDYSLHNQTLENIQSAKYIGITISDDMDWGQQISEISSKATKTLGFLRRNLASAPKSTEGVAYNSLIRPKQVYAAPIWSTYSKLQINQVESSEDSSPLDLKEMAKHTEVVSARCLMSLSGHLLRPVGIGAPCFSFI